MSDEMNLVLAVTTSAAAALVLTPVAMRVARALAFYDRPVGYKGHLRSTPYLGGAAVVSACLVAAVVFADVGRFGPILAGALVLCAVGTLDDHRSLSPGLRLAAAAGAGATLWLAGLGWSMADNTWLDGPLTVAWVVGLVNAFNLMDNMDGTMSAVAIASAAGIALVAVIHDDFALAALVLTLAGACSGFLRYNLARPAARVFLGDGGSMPTGLVLAAAVMALPLDETHGVSALLPATLLVGLVIFDTALVVVSRRRRRAKLMSGARDHVTHRLKTKLRTAHVVAGVLALSQTALCTAALALSGVEGAAVAPAAVSVVAAAVAGVFLFERENWLSSPVTYAPRDTAVAPSAKTGRSRVPRVITHIKAGGRIPRERPQQSADASALN